MQRVKLSRVDETLAELEYPISRADAVSALEGIWVEVADGEVELQAVVATLPSRSFESLDGLRMELYQYLPMAALGEPGQSEGDA
ncbi:hypothetical protein [Natronomonas sp. EA1]|uniref:DUF5789 family protein n=1 Tax=Natronomonas sp. EA1 TaxID=3421655 RepID=UPI003EBB9A8F